MNRLIPLKIFLFLFQISRAQVDNGFINHLIENNLRVEHFSYIEFLQKKISEDSLAYCKAQYHINYADLSAFLEDMKSSKKLILKDTLLLNRAAKLFLNQPQEEQRVFRGLLSGTELPYFTKSTFDVMLASCSSNPNEHFSIPQNLEFSYHKFLAANRKKPLVSALFSVVIPGSGKLYIGRTKSFINVLLTNIFNAISVYETNTRLGANNPYSVFCFSYAGLFYLANIFGSAYEVKQAKIEKRNQFLIDASNYFNNFCPYPITK